VGADEQVVLRRGDRPRSIWTSSRR